MRVADSTTRGSFTLGSTNKWKSASAVSEEIPENLNIVKEEKGEEDKSIPIDKTQKDPDEESSEGDILNQTVPLND